jgi:hypothetical protein
MSVQRPEEISSSSDSESLSTCTEIDKIFVPASMKGHAFNTMSSIELGRSFRSMVSLYFWTFSVHLLVCLAKKAPPAGANMPSARSTWQR